MNEREPSQSAEWRAHWPLVLSATAGMSFTAIASATMGLFMEPLAAEFGWSRTRIAMGLTIYAIVAIPLSPFAGAIIDRWGARRMALPGLALTACSFAAFGLADGSLLQWFALWLVYSLVALAIRNTVWTTAVSSEFTAARGMALAVTLAGSAVTQTLGPPATEWLIDRYGWRDAYFWLGLGWGSLVLVLLAPFFFDARDRHRRGPAPSSEGSRPELLLPGLTMAEAARSPALLRIAAATTLTIFSLAAIGVHLVPILTAMAISRETAALIAGTSGIAGIVGKIATGWVLDRWHTPWVSAASLALPAAACAILLQADGALAPVALAVVLLGYAGGAFLQICTYLTSRYAGMRNFGKIFGVMASLIAMGTGGGPLAAGLVYDLSGNYAPLLIAVIPLALVSGALMVGMGPYPRWPEPRPLPGAAESREAQRPAGQSGAL